MSSSDSDDENITLLREAVDMNFISDGMFNKLDRDEIKSTSNRDQLVSASGHLPAAQLTSQRYIECTEHEADLKIPKTMQDFVYKKMSKNIEALIEYVDVSVKNKKKRKNRDDEVTRIRLLNDTNPIINVDVSFAPTDLSLKKWKKPTIKRRIIEADTFSEEEKLQLASIDGETLLQQVETKFWKAKKVKPHKLFSYREKHSVLYLIEPTNEFSALRKKNNWSESKISDFSRRKK